MRDTVTGLVEAGEHWQEEEAACCVRVPAREVKEDELKILPAGDVLGKAESDVLAARLCLGSCVSLLESLVTGDLHNGVAVVRPELCEYSAAILSRLALTRGVERVLIVSPSTDQSVFPVEDGVLTLSSGREDRPGQVLALALNFRPDLVIAVSSPPLLTRQLTGLAQGKILVILPAGNAVTPIINCLQGNTITPPGNTITPPGNTLTPPGNSSTHRTKKSSLCVLYDSEMELHFTEATYTSHNGITLRPYPEGPQRIQGIWRALKEARILSNRKVSMVETGRLVTRAECCQVHTEQFWVSWLETDSLSQKERDSLAATMDSIFLNRDSVRCARLAAGGVLQCIDLMISGDSSAGFAIVRPPGHHAEADCSAGFCIFNNVAIAARYAVTHHGLERVLVLDWDVHHGNGTQHMFYGDRKVLYMSLHRYDHGKFYPCSEEANYDRVGQGEGEGFNVNIPWNGLQFGDAEYMMAFLQVVLPIAYEYNPQLILISAGFDAARGDPLSGYKVSPEMYGFMTHQLTALASGRVLVVLEGGYNVDSIAQSSVCCAEALLGQPHSLATPLVTEPRQSAVETVSSVVGQLSPYWQSLNILSWN